jgi:hypothetical protein
MSLTLMQTPAGLKEKINAQLPESVKQQRSGGGKTMLTYISGATVNDMLNAFFGPLNWSYQILNSWIQESAPAFNQYYKGTDKVTHNGKEGKWEEQGPVAWVHIRITVRMRDDETGHIFETTKEAFGSKSVIGKQSEQEHIFKAAQTDAMKKAASLFGIGLELYRNEEEQDFFESINIEPVWTDELKAKYADAWTIINTTCETNGWTLNELEWYVDQVTDGAISDINYMPEEYMSTFIAMLTAESTETE